MSHFPEYRPRRMRINENIRRLLSETSISPSDLISPVFVVHGENVMSEIPSMPNVFHLSIDMLSEEIKEIDRLGIPAVILFGVPEQKDPIGEKNFAPDGIVQRALREIKKISPELIVITDVCLCEYTDHGHCGLIKSEVGGNPEIEETSKSLPDKFILNDETLVVLGKVAVSHAKAGADIVAPSGMMDGMVRAIRRSLDDAGFAHVSILSYSAKYASAFYGPFRDAADCSPQFGDRQSYQMNPANAREAIREVLLDIDEGADLIMVKPALPYLDIIRQIRDRCDHPIAAYNVSGEYAMIKAAGKLGWLDEQKSAMESLISMKRAGADVIITYWAKAAARWFGVHK